MGALAMRHFVQLGFLATAVLFWGGNLAAAPPAIPPAHGPYGHPTESDFKEAESFKTGDRLVGTLLLLLVRQWNRKPRHRR